MCIRDSFYTIEPFLKVFPSPPGTPCILLYNNNDLQICYALYLINFFFCMFSCILSEETDVYLIGTEYKNIWKSKYFKHSVVVPNMTSIYHSPLRQNHFLTALPVLTISHGFLPNLCLSQDNKNLHLNLINKNKKT